MTYIPTRLDKGFHDSPHIGACVMEVASLLAKESWTDRPTCTNAVVTAMAQAVNDRLPDDERQKLWAFLPRIMRARRTDSDRRINVRLAIWCARQVLGHAADRAAAERAIEAAEAWLADPSGENAAAAYYAYYANAANAANAAAAYAAASAYYANAAALLVFLDGLLDEWQMAMKAEDEDLWVPAEWEDEALAFVTERMNQRGI